MEFENELDADDATRQTDFGTSQTCHGAIDKVAHFYVVLSRVCRVCHGEVGVIEFGL